MIHHFHHRSNELVDCFKEEFTQWLFKSNHPKVGCSNKHNDDVKLEFLMDIDNIEKESLQEILDILIREPLADYFWYGYPEHGGELSYSLPHADVAPGDALRVDKDKIKIFLRDYKINKILDI